MAEDSSRDPLPFEPQKKRNKSAKKSPPKPQPVVSSAESRQASSLNAIPEDVSRRMIRRMAICCGIPTGLGLTSFFLFYLVVSQGWLDLPPYMVFSVTLALFGAGVVGLSYGILSTSWETERPGGLMGWQEFRLNAGRLWDAWQTFRRESRQQKTEGGT